MKMKKMTALLLATLMVLSLAACGAKNGDNTASTGGGDSILTDEPKNLSLIHI